jgi:hypothetical protein
MTFFTRISSMRESRFRRPGVRLITCVAALTWLVPASSFAAPSVDVEAECKVAEKSSERYLRIVDDPSRTISLEIASRTFVHKDATKPTIALVSVAHIADQSFYDAIAEKLAAFDIVLYEAVAPAGVRASGGATTEEKVDSARQSLTFIASLIEKHRAARGEYPADLDALEGFVATLEPIVRNWFLHAIVDPWGQRIIYQRTEEDPGFELFSRGPLPDKVAADSDRNPASENSIHFDGHGMVHPLPRDESNLQKQLAEALGLAYQLESLPYDSPNWHISDITAEDLFRAFSGTDVDFDAFGGTLAGTSIPARLVGMLLRFIRMLDTMYEGAISDMVKVLFIEILGDEELVQASMKQMGADFGRILIDKRNQIVIDDLAALLENKREVESVAILYGAAHMPDLAERLADQLDYSPEGAVWLRAITVDLTESRIDQRQLMQMRSMIRRMMQSPTMRAR